MDTEKRYFRVRDDAPTDKGIVMTWNPEGNLGNYWPAQWDCPQGQWGYSVLVLVEQILEECDSDAPGAFEAKQWMRLSYEDGELKHWGFSDPY